MQVAVAPIAAAPPASGPSTAGSAAVPSFVAAGGSYLPRTVIQNSIYGAKFAPLASPFGGFNAAGGGGGGGSGWVGRYLRRGLHFSQWELDYIFYQLIYSCRSPDRVYKLTTHRKQTKNQWARDDPAFAIIQLAFLAICAVAYGIAYRYVSPLAYVVLILESWSGFLVGGLAIATALWHWANTSARPLIPQPHAVEQRVEWLYAFDVHCNAFVPVLVSCHVLAYLLAPLTLRDGLLPAMLANGLYAVAGAYYCYITFWGYVALPFLVRDKLRILLLPIAGIGVLFLLCTALQFNVARFMLGLSVA